MSDARFARLKTDPRFRRIRSKQGKVVVDDRFKSILDENASGGKSRARVDKYGRKLSKTKDQDDLKRFYRLNDEESADSDADAAPSAAASGPDYARGEGLLESSDEDGNDDEEASEESEPDKDEDDEGDSKTITFGRSSATQKKPAHSDSDSAEEDELPLEIDLDESNFAHLDAQAAAYSAQHPSSTTEPNVNSKATSRIAVVNLDWDHIKAPHLYKVFSSVVPPTSGRIRVLNVRVYPSQFGKERMAKEELEGPPAELFNGGARRKGKEAALEEEDEEDVNEETIFETGDAASVVNNDALRKYQLDRLRYYYAIVTFDNPQSASMAYNELDGTELERSANLFDLSYVPESMSFDDDVPRDEANEQTRDVERGGLDFVTDALRHSKVKLTWDDDDTTRVKVTRKRLTKKEIEENDFKAYIASSSGSGSSASESSADEDDIPPPPTSTTDPSSSAPKKTAKQLRDERRAKLRSLLSNTDDVPEGWGAPSSSQKAGELEVTFTPGLSSRNEDGPGDGEEEETTLERYKRRQKEKKDAKRAKREAKALGVSKDIIDEVEKDRSTRDVGEDDFFDAGAGDSAEVKGKKAKGKSTPAPASTSKAPLPEPSTPAELSAILSPSTALDGPKHFDMKQVLRAEKDSSKKNRFQKRKDKKRQAQDGGDGAEKEDGAGFEINVADPRFSALHEMPEFAIDPSNPQFKATKSMTALVQERSRRQKEKSKSKSRDALPAESLPSAKAPGRTSNGNGAEDISSLVESVKRKSGTARLDSGAETGNKRKKARI